MEDDTPVGTEKKFIIRLVGLTPGASREALVQALQRLFKGKSAEEIDKALDRLPLVLSRSVPEDKARQIKLFLEPQGAILRITYSASAIMAPPRETRRPETVAATEPAKAVESAHVGVERRAKPRAHAGIQVQPMGVGEIMDRSFRLLRQNFWLFFIIIFIPQAVFFVVNFGLQLLGSGDMTQDFSAGHGGGLWHFRAPGRAHIPGAAILGPGGADPRGVGNVSGSQRLDQGFLRSHAEPARPADRHADPVVHPGLSESLLWSES